MVWICIVKPCWYWTGNLAAKEINIFGIAYWRASVAVVYVHRTYIS